MDGWMYGRRNPFLFSRPRQLHAGPGAFLKQLELGFGSLCDCDSVLENTMWMDGIDGAQNT